MSYAVGIDLSSLAIDLVRLDENTNQAQWRRVALEGETAWERTRTVREAMPCWAWWDDVYLAAVETPFPDQQGVLRRVQGAVLASIPGPVLVWEANAGQWKRHLGLPGNASKEAVAVAVSERFAFGVPDWPQDALDALAVALWARDVNAAAVRRAGEAA